MYQTVANTWPIDFTLYPTGLFENFQVLGDRGLCKRECIHNITTDTFRVRRPVGENCHDFHARRMCKPLGQLSQFLPALTHRQFSNGFCVDRVTFRCHFRRQHFSFVGFLAVMYAEKTTRSVPSLKFQFLIISSLFSFLVMKTPSKPASFRICLTSSGEIAPAIQPV
jgi:hypothetical protein